MLLRMLVGEQLSTATPRLPSFCTSPFRRRNTVAEADFRRIRPKYSASMCAKGMDGMFI